ncbi:MAG: GNAT family N-acetyltransferase [Nocardioidaceae bacterium]|nr:GNAT family N-acetyltransferase [Nocardioidaceae bacterium]
MSPRFEDPQAARAEVEAAFKGDDASGAVALRDGRVVGFLLGAPKQSGTWGPNLWVESAGLAAEEPEDVRDLYALAATRWYDEGRTAHYVLVPAYDPKLVDAWFRLGFGQQHVHAVRELPTAVSVPPPGVVVRRAARDDIPTLATLDLTLPQHQALAPTFSAGHLGSYDEAVEEWEEDFDDARFATFVAEHDGVVVGSAVGCALELSGSNSGLVRPESAGFLGFAAVLPEHRGLGAGRAAADAVLDWCVEQGFSCVTTDWRATNLLSSRAWTSMGFRPSFLRLHRLLGY